MRRARCREHRLIDLTARYALDAGFHVVVEGTLSNMVAQLRADHPRPGPRLLPGRAVRRNPRPARHRPFADDVNETQLRDLPGTRSAARGIETVIGADRRADMWVPPFEREWAKVLENSRHRYSLTPLHDVVRTWQRRVAAAPAVDAYMDSGRKPGRVRLRGPGRRLLCQVSVFSSAGCSGGRVKM